MLLSSLNVIEIAGSAATSIAGGVLCDLGATVVMVEPSEGTELRRRPAFHVWSRGKQSIATPDVGHELRRLAPGADIVLVDEDTWARLGRPLLAGGAIVVEVAASTSTAAVPFGTGTAPSVGEAEAGLSWMQRGHRDGPFYVVEEPAALGTGLLAVIGALAADLGGHHSTRVRVSHTAGAVAMQLFGAVASPEPGHDAVPPDDGDAQRVTTPLVRFYECSDGWITIGVVTPARWANLCVALDMPELISDPRFDAAPFAIPEAADRMWLVEEITRADEATHGRGVARSPPGVRGDRRSGARARRLPRRRPGAGQRHALGGRRSRPRAAGRARVPHRHRRRAPREHAAAPAVGEHTADVIERFAARDRPDPVGHPVVSPPLAGTRVVDLSTFGAGPGASRILAGLGADVIKLEPPGGDPFRLLGYSFVGVNAGKRTCQLDIGDPKNRPLVDRALAGADVVVHNYRRDVAEKLAMRAEDISAVNPTAVQCAVSGYGAHGPRAGAAAIDVVFESLTGGPLVQGGGSEPVGYTGGFADNGTSLTAVVGVLASLLGRRAGTAPDGATTVEVSLLATTLYRHADLFVRPLSDWRSSLLGADPVGPDAAHRLYPVADGWVLLAIGDPAGWGNLREAVDGLPEVRAPGDPAWNDEVARVLTDAWRAREVDGLVDDLQSRGVPVARVERFGDFVRRLRAAGDPLVQDIADQRWGGLVGVNELVSFADASWRPLDGPEDLAVEELAHALHQG